MKIGLTGTRDGQPWPDQGEVLEVDDEEGKALCESGIAEPVKDTGKVEKATAPKAETRSHLSTKSGATKE